MEQITGLTRGGVQWTPAFVTDLNQETCIGCGRCYKVCAMDVLAYEEVDTEETAKAYMIVANAGKCIGCQACGRTCSKKCFTFEPVEAKPYGYTS